MLSWEIIWPGARMWIDLLFRYITVLLCACAFIDFLFCHGYHFVITTISRKLPFAHFSFISSTMAYLNMPSSVWLFFWIVLKYWAMCKFFIISYIFWLSWDSIYCILFNWCINVDVSTKGKINNALIANMLPNARAV